MSVFKAIFGSSKPAATGSDSTVVSVSEGPQTLPGKMNLEERMAFRREVLYESVKVSMQAHGMLSASYRFRVVRADRRGHQYLVMVDLCTDFLHKREGQPAALAALGEAITRTAAARCGVMVTGVYWQVNAQMPGFEAGRPATALSPATSAAPGRKPGRATHEEVAAFEEAWKQGREFQIGERVYLSDMAPLSAGGDAGEDSRR